MKDKSGNSTVIKLSVVYFRRNFEAVGREDGKAWKLCMFERGLVTDCWKKFLLKILLSTEELMKMKNITEHKKGRTIWQ
jgi:hypothetical protein